MLIEIKECNLLEQIILRRSTLLYSYHVWLVVDVWVGAEGGFLGRMFYLFQHHIICVCLQSYYLLELIILIMGRRTNIKIRGTFERRRSESFIHILISWSGRLKVTSKPTTAPAPPNKTEAVQFYRTINDALGTNPSSFNVAPKSTASKTFFGKF